MKRIKHPHADVIKEVPDSQVDAWREQGWLVEQPTTREPAGSNEKD